MFYLLDRYIAKNNFFYILITLLTLISLSSIIKFIDQLKKINQGEYNLLDILYYTMLTIPKDITIFFSIAVLIGSLIGLGYLSQSNEIISMQNFGLSYLKIILSVIKITIPLVLINMLISEFISPKSEQIARNYRSKKIYGNEIVNIKNGLWTRDKNSFIYIKNLKNSTNLININIYVFNHKNNLTKLIHAKSAKWEIKNKYWILLKVKKVDLKKRNQVINTYNSIMVWHTNLTPDKLFIFRFHPDTFSINTLYKYSKYLIKNKQDPKIYQLNMWIKIFQPFLLLIMLAISVSFIIRPLNHISIRIRILIGIIFSLIIYVFNKILSYFSLLGGLSPIFSAILPIVIFLIISFILLFFLKKNIFLKYF